MVLESLWLQRLCTKTYKKTSRRITPAGAHAGAFHRVRIQDAPVNPALSTLGATTYAIQSTEGRGLAIGALSFVCDAINGLQAKSYLVDANHHGRIRTHLWFAITPHAIARCLQRNGQTQLSAITEDVLVAGVLASRIVTLCHAYNWRQAPIPTPRGVFLGAYCPDEKRLTMRTYIRPGANDRDSKWSELIAEFPPLPAPGTVRQWTDMDEYRDTLAAWMDFHGETVTRQFSFVQQPHEDREDPLKSRWDAAREAASACAP